MSDKIIDIPFVVNRGEWTDVTAEIPDRDVKKRLIMALEREWYYLKLEAENQSMNVKSLTNDPGETA